MLPRFANPHLLPQTSSILTRAEIYADDALELHTTYNEDPEAVHALNELIQQSLSTTHQYLLPTPRRASTTQTKPHHEQQSDDIVLFRLVSSRSPISLSLLPPPPPPSKTREPDAEDTEERAFLREQYAQEAAIEGSEIVRQSEILKVSSSRTQPVEMRVSDLRAEPPVMILRTLQPPRRTRPPLPPHLLQYPYIHAPDLPLQPPISKIPGCVTADAHPVQTDIKKTRSRRRRKAEVKERPPPQFWRPSPNMEGKCRGYAYGYPSSLPSDYIGTWTYRRDTMKKARVVNSFDAPSTQRRKR